MQLAAFAAAAPTACATRGLRSAGAAPAPRRAAARPAAAVRARPARLVVQAFQGGEAPAGTVPVTFVVNRKVHFGQQVLLVGSTRELGCWGLEGAVHMAWAEGHEWSATVSLPAGCDIEYKLVVTDKRHPPEWESCWNRKLKIESNEPVRLAGEWNGALAPACSLQDAAAPGSPAGSDGAGAGAGAKGLETAFGNNIVNVPREMRISPEAEAAVDSLIAEAEGQAAAQEEPSSAGLMGAAFAAARKLASAAKARSANGAPAKGRSAATKSPAPKRPSFRPKLNPPSPEPPAASATPFSPTTTSSSASSYAAAATAQHAKQSSRRGGSRSRSSAAASDPTALVAKLSPEQLAFLERKERDRSRSPGSSNRAPRPSSRTPSPTAPAKPGLSAEQRAFLERSGKL